MVEVRSLVILQVYGTTKRVDGESMSMGRGVGRVLCGGGDGGGRDYTAVTFTSDRYQKRHLRLGEERKSTSGDKCPCVLVNASRGGLS